jgi:hypothetical protein
MSEWPGFRATLLRGFPETKEVLCIAAHFPSPNRQARLSHWSNLPSVSCDLTAISEQQPHHYMVLIDPMMLFMKPVQHMVAQFKACAVSLQTTTRNSFIHSVYCGFDNSILTSVSVQETNLSSLNE